MPNKDGTGPTGQGAMTGGGRGYCGGVANDTGARPMNGRGLHGRGGRRGFRNCFKATGLPGCVRGQRGMRITDLEGKQEEGKQEKGK